jgi:ribose/xylose/arabinose/galactoside ABC-type transport system permease subunit
MTVGAVNQLTANLAAGAIIAGTGTAVALAVGTGVGILFGLVNGLLIVLLRMPPFVATLGTMFIAIGMSFAYNGGQALTLSNEPDFFWLGQGYVGPVPVVLMIVVLLAVGLHLLLKRTRTGLRMYTVGQNIFTARLRGVSRSRAILLGSMLAGVVAGLSGVLFASYGYGASALATGLDFLITALAAAFLGSALSRTGELDILWTLVASMFLAAINSGLILLGATSQVLPGIQGAILILSIVPGVIRRRDIGQVLIF